MILTSSMRSAGVIGGGDSLRGKGVRLLGACCVNNEVPGGLGGGLFLPIGGSGSSFKPSIDLTNISETLPVCLLLEYDAGGRGDVALVMLDMERAHFSWTELVEELGDGRGCELVMETE
jgi:hypothetical protein